MPGYLPGIPGFVAFAGIKFGGYVLAGLAMKKVQPSIAASAVKIAATRTGLGILLGPPMTLLGAFAIGLLSPNSNSDMPLYGTYVFLFIVRILVWALVVFIFTKRSDIAKSRLWMYASVGALWSCLLDLPGFGLAFISPGKIPIC
jgi:hypothetical protein